MEVILKAISECGLLLPESAVVGAGQHETREPAAVAATRRHLLEVDGEWGPSQPVSGGRSKTLASEVLTYTAHESLVSINLSVDICRVHI